MKNKKRLLSSWYLNLCFTFVLFFVLTEAVLLHQDLDLARESEYVRKHLLENITNSVKTGLRWSITETLTVGQLIFWCFCMISWMRHHKFIFPKKAFVAIPILSLLCTILLWYVTAPLWLQISF